MNRRCHAKRAIVNIKKSEKVYEKENKEVEDNSRRVIQLKIDYFF